MKSRFLAFTIAVLLTVCLHANEETEKAAQRFREALKSIDRVILIRNGADTDPAAKFNLTIPEIKGTGAIASLGEILELESLGDACACVTSPEITFYTGTTYRFELTLHDGFNLRCQDGPWSGDARMTDKGAARFRAWFAEHGFGGFVREENEANERMAKGEKERSQLLSLFPEKTRDVFASENAYKIPLETKAEQLASAFPFCGVSKVTPPAKRNTCSPLSPLSPLSLPSATPARPSLLPPSGCAKSNFKPPPSPDTAHLRGNHRPLSSGSLTAGAWSLQAPATE